MAVSWSGVLWRMLFAIALVLLTFNPTGHSFYHWLTAPPSTRPMRPSDTNAVRRQAIQLINRARPATALSAVMPVGGAVSQCTERRHP